MIENFHLLRPWWLLALPALACLAWLLRRHGPDSGNWRSVIDPRLLPHLLASGSGQRRDWLSRMLIAVAAVAIIALSGPTWEKRSQATYQQPSALVVALDLSRSMNATDIRPSRLTRARHKIADILNTRNEGQTALVVYAADAFAVTPLTSDSDTIMALLPDLDTRLMPAQGSRADRAFERALELFANGGISHGDLLLVSDGFSEDETLNLQALIDRNPQHRVSVLAIGTADGGPIPLKNGGFLKDRAGNIVVAIMNSEGMNRIAEQGQGVYSPLSSDDRDIETLARLMQTSTQQQEALLSDRTAQQWRELGPTLLLLVLPFAAMAFRRGLLWTIPLLFLLLPPEAYALEWQDLWSNRDQRALKLFEQGEHEAAAELFADEDWRASANYRAGEFETAAGEWQQLDSDDARYNHANALAQQGLYEEAIAAYDSLLRRSPDHADARYNRQAIADWLEQQQTAQQDQQGQQDEQEQSDESSGGGQQSQSANGQGSESQDSGDQSNSGGGSAETGEQPGDENQAQSDSAGGESSEQDGNQDELSAQQQQAQSGEQESADAAMSSLDQQMTEQAAEQWLRKIPDDPGGLLRRKFVYQYRSRGGVDTEEQTW